MKINLKKPLNKNTPRYVHSVFYPAAGYVAIPENKPLGSEGKKDNKKIKGLQQERVEMIKKFLSDIVFTLKKKGKRLA